jgi:hypothetical protein
LSSFRVLIPLRKCFVNIYLDLSAALKPRPRAYPAGDARNPFTPDKTNAGVGLPGDIKERCLRKKPRIIIPSAARDLFIKRNI